VLRYLQNQSTRRKILTLMGWEFTGLSTFNPFSEENAFQVDTKARFGKQAFARKFPAHQGKYL